MADTTFKEDASAFTCFQLCDLAVFSQLSDSRAARVREAAARSLLLLSRLLFLKKWLCLTATNANAWLVLPSVFAGCQIPYPKREFLNEDEPEEKTEKVILRFCSCCCYTLLLLLFLLPSPCTCEPCLWMS